MNGPVIGTLKRQIKYSERWYVDPWPTAAGEFKLKQTRSDTTVALFPLVEEARWVCNKLNFGRALCEAVRNAINVDDWLGREPQALVEDLRRALTDYMKDND